MRWLAIAALVVFAFFTLSSAAIGQGEDICREAGEAPSREIARPGRRISYVYGLVVLKGVSQGKDLPKVVVTFSDSLQPGVRQTIGRSGSYCFRIQGTGAKLLVEVDGVEAARKSVSELNIGGLREDFEVYPSNVQQTAPPGVVSAKFTRPQNPGTVGLYKKTAEAEKDKQLKKELELVQQIVAVDPDDFIAWAKLGTLYLEDNSLVDAESAFRKCIKIRKDYAPALLNIGMIHAFQNRYTDAIDMFERAVASDPQNARAYRLLGEAYLQNRQGNLGLVALDEALRLDPTGMAECHLLKARLYDLAGARNLASHEYKVFLTKVKDHPDSKQFEKYVKENPE